MRKITISLNTKAKLSLTAVSFHQPVFNQTKSSNSIENTSLVLIKYARKTNQIPFTKVSLLMKKKWNFSLQPTREYRP